MPCKKKFKIKEAKDKQGPSIIDSAKRLDAEWQKAKRNGVPK